MLRGTTTSALLLACAALSCATQTNETNRARQAKAPAAALPDGLARASRAPRCGDAGAIAIPSPTLPADLDVDVMFTRVAGSAAAAAPSIGIALTMRGSDAGSSALLLGSAQTEHPEREVRELCATGDDGAALAIEPRDATPGTGAAWIVRHAPGATIHLRYTLTSTQARVTADPASYTRPILTPTFVQVLGVSSLVVPGWVSPSAVQRVRIHWQGFREANWTVADSFAIDPDGSREERSWSDLRDAVYLAGDFRLASREVHGTPIAFALPHAERAFSDEALIDLVTAIATTERDFFGDAGAPLDLVSVIPVEVEHAGARDFGGIALARSIALFLGPNVRLAAEADGTGLPFLVAHETFHQWNGRRYRTRPAAHVAWFTEGFSAFYARRLLRRAGLIDDATYLANLNDAIARDARRPIGAPPDPYAQGDVVALLVDAELRRRSHGARSLDDWMREALVERSPLPEIDADTVLGWIASATSPAFADSMRAVTVDRVRASVPPDLLAPCFAGHVERSGRFDVGFDLAASRRAHAVVGLVPGSNAARAGLRADDIVLDADLRPDDAAHPVVLHLGAHQLSGEPARVLTYLPAGSADAKSDVAVAVFSRASGSEVPCF